MKSHHISFIHAADGIKTAFKTQPNFKIHLTISCFVVLLAYGLKVTNLEWAILFFVIATGLSIELINTAIEYTVDLLTDEYHLLAKYAKDTAAGAMLVYAILSIVIAAVIFLPYLSN